MNFKVSQLKSLTAGEVAVDDLIYVIDSNPTDGSVKSKKVTVGDLIDSRIYGISSSQFVLITGYYADPSWITSLDWSKITNAPSFVTSLSALTDVSLSSPVPNQLLRYNGTSWYNWTPTYYSLPAGGTTLQYIDGTGALQTLPTTLPTSTVKHLVKAGVPITKGQAVYVTSADGTNMIVGLASNASESTSSKTMGLLDATVTTNGFANVVTEGLLAGLDTTGANAAGDPVWLGTNGNLIYGLVNKPYAPNHLVFIGIVTRRNANNGEIFVKVQNGFELSEIHDVDARNPDNNDGIFYNSTTQLWEHKQISSVFPTPTLASVTTAGNTTTNSISTGNITASASNIASLTLVDTLQPYAWSFRNNGTNLLFVNNGGTNIVKLTAGGNVLVGTNTDSGFKLDVNGDTRVSGSMTVNNRYLYHQGNSAIQYFMTSNAWSGTNSIFFGDDSSSTIGSIIYNHQFDSLAFTVNGTNALHINSSRNIGIGTTSPTNAVHIRTAAGGATSNYALVWQESTGDRVLGYLGADNSAFFSGALYLYQNGVSNTKITANGTSYLMGGNVLIGTTTDAGYKLDVSGTARVTGNLTLGNNTDVNILFGSSSTLGISGGKININNNTSVASNFSVGTTSLSASARFLVGGSISLAGDLGRAMAIESTITANANNAVLVGLDINPTFTNGAFTGVTNYGIRTSSDVLFSGNFIVGTSSYTPNDGSNISYTVRSRTGIYVANTANNFGISYEGGRIYGNIGYGASNPILTPVINNWISNVGLTALSLLGTNGLFTGGINKFVAPTGGTDLTIIFAGSVSTSLVQGRVVAYGEAHAPKRGALEIYAGADTTYSNISFFTTGTEKLRIANTGNLLVGTTTDSGYKLDVRGGTVLINRAIFGVSSTGGQSLRVVASTGGVDNVFSVHNEGSSIQYFGITSNTGLTTFNSNWNIGSRLAADTQSLYIITDQTTAALSTLTVRGGNAISSNRGGGNLILSSGASAGSGDGINGYISFNITNVTASTGVTNSTSEVARFSLGKNLLINTTTDAGYKLDVAGTTRVVGTDIPGVFTVGWGKSNTITLGSNTANSPQIYLGSLSLTAHPGGSSLAIDPGVLTTTGTGVNTNRPITIVPQVTGTSTGNMILLSSGARIGASRHQPTSGVLNMVAIGDAPTNQYMDFAPASGNATFNSLFIKQQINTSGTYAGIVRGIYYDPTLTSTIGVTHRAIETTSGDVIFNTQSAASSANYTTMAVGGSDGVYFQMYVGANSSAQSLRGQIWAVGNNLIFNNPSSGYLGLYTTLYSGITVFPTTGNVHIGTSATDAGYKLDVNGIARTLGTHRIWRDNAIAEIKLELFGGQTGWESSIYHNIGSGGSDQRLTFRVGGNTSASDRMTISGSNVGVGTTSPTGRNGYGGGTLVELVDNIAYASFNLNGGNISSPTYFTLGAQGAGADIRVNNKPLRIAVNSVDVLTIPTTGNVLINTTTDAGYKLDVNGTVRFQDHLIFSSTKGIYASSALSTVLQSSLNYFTHNRIASSGTLGYQIAVVGNVQSFWRYNDGTGDVEFGNANGSYHLGLYAGNTERVKILGNGNVGIGTTSPTAKVHVVGSGSNSATSSLIVQNSGGSVTPLKTTDDGTAYIGWDSTGDFNGIFYANGNVGIGRYSKFIEGRNNASSEVKISSQTWNFTTSTFYSTSLSLTPAGVLNLGSYSGAASSILTMTSTTRGFLAPRMTTAQILAITTPAEGLQVYNTDLHTICFFDGTIWQRVTSTAM